MKNFGQFHDGSFQGFLESGATVHLFLLDDYKKQMVITAHGVLDMRIDGVREGNIILDVLERQHAELSDADLGEFIDGDGPETAGRALALLKKVQTRRLTLLQVSPSYGASCSILAEHFEIITRAQWLEAQAASAGLSGAGRVAGPHEVQ